MKSSITQMSDLECNSCKDRNNVIELTCGHCFCLKCLAYSYHKHKFKMCRTNQTRCNQCKKTVELNNNELRSIDEFTEQVLVPLLEDQVERTNVKTQPNDSSALSKKFVSHEQSIDKKTPDCFKFYSKCQSPHTGLSEVNCPLHPDQQLVMVCLTCSNALLCISCTSNKKHSSHTVKSLSKGFELIQQKLDASKMQSRQHIGFLEGAKKKLQEQKIIIQQRCQKAKSTLKMLFDNLIELINKKNQEITLSCSDIFAKLIEQLSRDEERVEQALKVSHRQMQQLVQTGKQPKSYIQLIKNSTRLIEEVMQFKDPQLQCVDFSGAYEWEMITKDIGRLCEQVQRISLESSCDFNSTTIKASRSEEKLLKENFGKRTKTNMISLNSSRERRDKKYTKTQEDQRRNKTKANYKTQSASKLTKVNKAYPAYLVQHTQKVHPLQSFTDNNGLTSSFKSTSKLLSKSHQPGQEGKRKKEHVVTMVKQRMERKTFNGITKEHKPSDGMRKKKIPY